MANDIYATEQSTTPDQEQAKQKATAEMLGYYNATEGNIEQSDSDRIWNKAYNTYQAPGQLGYEGSGLFNPNSALFGGSGAAAEAAYNDVNKTTEYATDMADIAKQSANERQAVSNKYGESQLGTANGYLGTAAQGLLGLTNSGDASARNIRGVAGPGTEGLTVQGRDATLLGQFDPTSANAANALHANTLDNAAALHSLALSGRGGGVNASAQARGAALGQSALAGEGLQQQQLAVQQYQSNQALLAQALQGQAALGASQQSGALTNAQLSQQKQAIAAQAALQGAQTQYGAHAAASSLYGQQAQNTQDAMKYQNQVAGNNVDAQQTLGQVNANYLGQAQDFHNQQLSTEAQLRTQGLINAAQTRAGLQNTMLGINTQEGIANQAANTAMLGSMLSTGAGAVSAYSNSKEKDQW